MFMRGKPFFTKYYPCIYQYLQNYDLHKDMFFETMVTILV